MCGKCKDAEFSCRFNRTAEILQKKIYIYIKKVKIKIDGCPVDRTQLWYT